LPRHSILCGGGLCLKKTNRLLSAKKKKRGIKQFQIVEIVVKKINNPHVPIEIGDGKKLTIQIHGDQIVVSSSKLIAKTFTHNPSPMNKIVFPNDNSASCEAAYTPAKNKPKNIIINPPAA